MPGELLTIWTIRISLALYASVLAGHLLDWPSEKVRRILRWMWTISFVFFIVHLVAAFQFYHGWSHQIAFDDTAEQTRDMIGVAFGHGIFFSYAFAVLWCFDVAWWWVARTRYDRRAVFLNLAIHGYLLFIAFNGAIIFEGGITRSVGLVVTAGLAILLVKSASGKNRIPRRVTNSLSVAAAEIDEQPIA
jgi:hypothetical protein